MWGGERNYYTETEPVMVLLEVPHRAERVHVRTDWGQINSKFRVSEALVLAMFVPNRGETDFTKPYNGKAFSSTNHKFIYEVGKTVKPEKPFSRNKREVCESGIHAFMRKVDAENYF